MNLSNVIPRARCGQCVNGKVQKSVSMTLMNADMNNGLHRTVIYSSRFYDERFWTLRALSGRTCTKCRLHDQIEPLKGHKRVCPFASCACARCASHDHILAHKNNIRVQHKHNKGRSWRRNILPNSITSTTTSTPLNVQFPEMQRA